MCAACNVLLEKDDYRFGWVCPICNRFYGERILKMYDGERSKQLITK